MVRLCSALVILGFLSLLHVVPCNVLTKLTKDESEHNAEHCGYNFINRKTHHSSDRGDKKEVKQELFINQYPWIANIRVRGVSTCDGALISPRHVVTAARCVVETSPKENCEKRDIMKLKAAPEEFTVQVGSRCTDPNDDFCADMWIKAKELACHEDFDECTFANDIAVVELEEIVNSTAGIPICMPGFDQVQNTPLFISSALGQPRGQKGKHKAPYHVLRNYYLNTKDKFIFTALPPKIRICESDIGGPLFNKDETSTLMGIASHSNTCDENVESNDDQDPWDSQISAEDSPWNDDEKWDMCELKYVHTSFVDLRSYRRWICSTTGVCPKDAESASDGEFEDRDACENSGNLPLLNSLQIFVLASILFVNNI